MSLNKVKYFGLCATALLTITPIATSAVTIASQPITSDVVKADAIDTDYQNSLTNGFGSTINVTASQLADLASTAIKGEISQGSFVYDNVGPIATNTKVLFDNTSSSPAADADLYTNLQDSFLKLFVSTNSKVGFLAKANVKTKMTITGPKLSTPTSASDQVRQLQTLTDNDKFSIALSTTNASGDVIGTKTINVTVSPKPAKIGLAPVAGITATTSTTNLSTENATDVAKAIKNSRGEQAFKASDISSFVAAGHPFYYAVDTTGAFTASTATSKYELASGVTGAVYTQLIPIEYTRTVADTYDASSFVFLDSANKITATVPAAGAGEVAYVKRQVTVGTVASKDYPVFKYLFSGSSNPTYKNGDVLTVNSTDKEKLTYKYNDQTTFDAVETFVKGADFNGNLKAYKSVSTNDAGVGAITESIKYTMPDIKSTAATSYVLASITNSDNGTTSTVKIPVTVTDIPTPLTAPTVTTFPTADLNATSKTTKSIDPLSGVKATYVGSDGKTKDLTKDNIKITVTDSANKDVALNSDGTVPTTTNGTYKITYVFSNPDDTSKTVTKTLNLTVTDTNLVAPTVNGFVEGTYTLSNVNRKSINPFDALLKTDKIDASYVGLDGKKTAIANDKVKVTVADSANKAVALNSDGTIPMTTVGTYKVTYTFANGDDAAKTTAKTVTLNVNAATTGMPVAVYHQGATQDVTTTTKDTPSINPTDGSVTFSYTYTDAGSSSPTTADVSKDLISVSVTKDGKAVSLDSAGKFATEVGTYKVNYSVINPKDNATVLNYTRTFTVNAPTPAPVGPTITPENGIVYVNYVPGYGVNVWKSSNTKDGAEALADGSLRKLQHGTAWKYDQVATYADGSTWYRVGKNQWIQGEYASKTAVVAPSSWSITDIEGVGTINYVPGYGVNLWTSPDQTTWTRKLDHGTAWKYFKIARKDGVTMYNLGGNQWVDGTYFK
ncbi:hypothetical protein [Xylocopilactobacillus apicola]|uniref:Uncharacterized protein n=1 Tax=Xylocopilactobacillus apicola TaxID=2932184 RepID=A0AAU9DBS8_9LACO|nr:hypothetical protein [Xylocopilactobacillus apicola]BDR58990.1 hypothetical protein XA3_14310 [Xylocopilactobacillus apicola]